MAKKLIDASANINAHDLDELYTPLHDAVRMNNMQITKLLLESDANPTLVDRWENTPYDIAKEYGFEEIMKLFKA